MGQVSETCSRKDQKGICHILQWLPTLFSLQAHHVTSKFEDRFCPERQLQKWCVQRKTWGSGSQHLRVWDQSGGWNRWPPSLPAIPQSWHWLEELWFWVKESRFYYVSRIFLISSVKRSVYRFIRYQKFFFNWVRWEIPIRKFKIATCNLLLLSWGRK